MQILEVYSSAKYCSGLFQLKIWEERLRIRNEEIIFNQICRVPSRKEKFRRWWNTNVWVGNIQSIFDSCCFCFFIPSSSTELFPAFFFTLDMCCQFTPLASMILNIIENSRFSSSGKSLANKCVYTHTISILFHILHLI